MELDPAAAWQSLVLETTGASTETPTFIQSLRRAHEVRLVRVYASAETCAARIAERDSSRQVDVPADLIRTMQARTDRLQLPWDLELQNDPPLTEKEIVEAFQPILRTHPSHPVEAP